MENENSIESKFEIRRDFLKKLAAAGSAALMTGQPQFVQANDGSPGNPPAKADACILLWMAGGMAAPDTFDPKRYSPYKEGLEIRSMLSTFPAIDTAVDNIKICAGTREHCFGDGSGHVDSNRRAARLGKYFAFEASVPLAHWLRAAPNRRLSSYRSLDSQGARASQSRDSGFHQYRPAIGRCR